MKVIASDLDGTLLNRFHVMDRYILSAIDLALMNDIIFIVATGRNLNQDEVESMFVNRPIYQVTSNGAIVKKPNGELLFKKTLDKKFIQELLHQFPDIPFDFITEETTWINTSKKRYLDGFDVEKKKLNKRLLKIVNSFMMNKQFDVDDDTILKQEILKVNCRISNETLRAKFNEFLSKYPNIINAPFSQQIYELTDVSVNKANGVKLICDMLKIDYAEVVTFGDGGNDLELLEEFESYAPSNAIEAAKKRAKNHIGHYYTYAVARKIKRLVRKNRRVR